MVNPDNTVTYLRFETLEDNKSFKQYSVGIYLYLQMLRVLIMFLLVCSVLAVAQMVFNYQGRGLEPYPKSYTLTVLKTSLGNNSEGTETQMIIQTACDAGYTLILLAFVVYWRRRSSVILEKI